MFFKKKYIYVDRCPRCGSFKTGYIVRRNTEKECNAFVLNRLLHGELVFAELGIDFGDMEHNLFCANCNVRWFGKPEIRRLTALEIEEQKELRGIDEELIQEWDIRNTNSLSRKIAAKQLRKQKAKFEKSEQKVKVKQEKNEIKTKK